MAYNMPKAMAKAKLKMVKGPDGDMVPEYAVDGEGANDLAKMKHSAMKMKTDPPKTLISSEAASNVVEAANAARAEKIAKQKQHDEAVAEMGKRISESAKSIGIISGGSNKNITEKAKNANKMMKDPVTKMAKSMAYMAYGKSMAKNIGPKDKYIGPEVKSKKY